MAQGCPKPIPKKRKHLQIHRWNYLRPLGATGAHKSINLALHNPKKRKYICMVLLQNQSLSDSNELEMDSSSFHRIVNADPEEKKI